MSYTTLVAGNSPLGYWKLNGSGSAVVGSAASVSSPTWTSLPLVSNSASALLVKPSGASVSIYNNSTRLYKRHENEPMTFEFWFSFNSNFDGSGYYKNLDSSTQYFLNNKLEIIKILNGSTQIGSIYYNYTTNTFRFSFNDPLGADSYIPVRNLNTSFYIVATYANRSLQIFVNGEPGVKGYVSDTYAFPTINSSSVYFQINGNSLTSSASMNYVIGDLAIYGNVLRAEQQKMRVMMALNASKPMSITEHLETSYFDIYENDTHTLMNDIHNGESFDNNEFDKNNLVVKRNEGIAYHYVKSLEMSNSTPSGSVSFTASGASFVTQPAALVMQDYGEFFQHESHKILTCQLTIVSPSANYGYICSLQHAVDHQDTLFAYAASSSIKIGVYDTTSNSSTVYITVPCNLNASGTYDFGMTIDSNNVHAYIDGNVDSSDIPNLTIDSGTKLVIGNLAENSASTSMMIKNFGLNNELQTTFSGYDFAENKMFMARLTTDYSVSQMLRWVKKIPLSKYDSSVIGSKVTWDAMDNCAVQVSDDGYYWTNISRDSQIPGIKYGSLNRDKLLRVLVPHEYTIQNSNQSFYNLELMLYRDLRIDSNDHVYSLNPGYDNTASPSYIVKRFPQSVLLRQKNLGLLFESIGGKVNGYATITNTSSTSYQPSAIDFWFRADSLSSSSNQYLIDIDELYQSVGATYIDSYTDTYYDTFGLPAIANVGSPVEYESDSLYIDAASKKLIYSPNGGTVLYVNGASYSSSAFIVTPGEFYHIMFDFGTRINLVGNPSFETNTTGWNPSSAPSATISRDTATKYFGSAGAKITWGTSSATQAFYHSINTIPGRTYTISSYVYVPSGNPNVRVDVFFKSSSTVTLKDQWVRASTSFVATANTHSVGIAAASATSGNIAYFDAFLAEESPILEDYFEGTITRSLSSSATIYINSKYGSSSGTHVNGSYGHINIWKVPIQSTTALERYTHFVGNNITGITDTPSSLWQPNWQSDAVTPVTGYKIG